MKSCAVFLEGTFKKVFNRQERNTKKHQWLFKGSVLYLTARVVLAEHFNSAWDSHNLTEQKWEGETIEMLVDDFFYEKHI